MRMTSATGGGRSWWRSVSSAGTVAAFLLGLAGASAQVPTTVTVAGSVVDATSGQPVPHALVKLGQRAVLTDTQGQFSFARVESSLVSVSAAKPGYSFTQLPGDATERALQPNVLANPLLLRLYPEAVLVGTLTDEDGAPIRNVPVKALRGAVEEDGRHWVTAGLTHTDARGQFRFGVPAGDYRVESDYVRISPHLALLPASFPGSSAPGEHAIHVKSRDQTPVDLHPTHAQIVDVVARVDGEAVKDLSQLTAHSGSGLSFPIEFTAAGPSEIDMSVPVGNYVVEAKQNVFGTNSWDLAILNVTPPEHSPLAATMHFAPVAPVPITLRVDEAAIAAAGGGGVAVPNQSALGLSLEPTQTFEDSEPLRPVSRSDGSIFVAPAGSYRLHARPGGTWYVVSANAGGVDLLRQDLQVAAGSGAMPIALTVSRLTASLRGTTNVGGKPAACYVYLVSLSPSASPVFPLHSGPDGTYSTASLPPGSYNAIAFTSRRALSGDDPSALADYQANVGSITVQAGEKAKLDLEAVPDADVKP